MLAALAHWQPDAQDSWVGSSAGLGHLLLSNTPEAGLDAQPAYDAATSNAITADLRLDNRGDLAAALAISAPELTRMPDSTLVLRAYQRWGEACVEHLRGDFAFAIWDEARRCLFCARDQIGIKPFYYATTSDGFAFGSEIKALLALPFVDRAPDEQWIADFLHRLMLDNEATFYRAIRRLPPAHTLTVAASGVRSRRYWQPDTERELRLGSDQDYIDAFREQLDRAVRVRLRTTGGIGSELSGGLDSSALSAIAHRLLREQGRELLTFSQVRPTADADLPLPKDSREQIDQLIQHTGITRASFVSGADEGIEQVLEWANRHYDEPPQWVVSLFHDLLYEEARAAGVRVLVSGFGGNQAVTSEGIGVQEELLLSGQWRELWRELAAESGRSMPIRATGVLLVKHLAARLALDDNRRHPFWQKFEHRPLRLELRERLGMRERARQFRERYTHRGSLRERAAGMLGTPNVPCRLEYANLDSTARRIQYVYPLLDVELIEFYLSVPSRMKRRRGIGRYLFRDSMAGLLPDQIRWSEAPRTSANPSVVARKRRDRAALQERLAAVPRTSPLFDYVDLERLRAKPPVTRLGANHPWERDTELLNLLMLEQKLRGVS